MADETLRRNLDRTFDQGPDFPHPLLLSRTMAALAAEAGRARRSPDRSGGKTWFSLAIPQTRPRLLAAVVTVGLVAAAAGAFFSVYQYAHRSVPVRTRPVSVSGPCSQGLHMVTSTIGWIGTSRTTDGGVTWQDVSPSMLPNSTIKWGKTTCTLDADHAWTTQTTGLSIDRPDHVVVFATHDGGQTWQPGESIALLGSETANAPGTTASAGGWVPAPGVTRVEVSLQFIDDQHGWLLTDAGAWSSPPPVRSIYATSDGGLHWTLLTSEPQGSGSALGKTAVGCAESGMTFINADRGWLTWDCSQGNANIPPLYGGPVVAITGDGGRSWTSVSLPTYTGTGICRASAPVFNSKQGVLPVTCSSPGSWGVIFRTGDAGATWSPGQVPFPTELLSSLPDTWSHRLDFLDANRGWAFVPDSLTRSGAADASTSNQLYRTTDAGRTWVVVKKGLFPGQLIDSFQFIDAGVGFAYTSSSGPWKTTDGGITWSYQGPPRPGPANPLNVGPSTPVILFYDVSDGQMGGIDGMTWDGQVGRVTTMPSDQYATPTSSNPAGTLFYASPNIFNRSGRVVATLTGGGYDFPGTWADDNLHYCQIAPTHGGGTSTVTGTFAVTGTLQLTTPGGTPRDVAQLGTQDPGVTTFTVAVCSVLADRAVVVQTISNGNGYPITQYWVMQLSTGHLLWTRDLRGIEIVNLVASRDGRYVAEFQSSGTSTIYSTSFSGGVAVSPNGTAVGHVKGRVQAFSWDGSLAVVGPLGERASVIRWSDGTVLWTVPTGQGLSFVQPEPEGSSLAILTLRTNSDGTAAGPTVLYVVSSDGHVLAQREAPYDFLLGCSPTFSGEGGVGCGLRG